MCADARDQLSDVLQVEVDVWQAGGVRSPAPADTRGRERPAEEAAGRGDARQRGVEGPGIKKMVTPGATRDAVAHPREHHGLSERRACNLVGVSRRVARYRPSRPDDGPLRQRLRDLAREPRRFGYRRLGLFAGSGGHDAQPQEAAEDISRGEPAGTPPRRPQTRLGHQGADGAAGRAEPALVTRLRVRHADVQPALSHPVRGRRLHAGMPGAGGRHVTVGHAGRARIDAADRAARQTAYGSQR